MVLNKASYIYICIYTYIFLGYSKCQVSHGFIFGICFIKFQYTNEDWVLALDQNNIMVSLLPERPNRYNAAIL